MTAPERDGTESIALSGAIADYTRRHGITMQALGRRAGIGPAYLQALVDGETDVIDPDAVEAIARVLGVVPAELREYRIAILLASLVRGSERLEAMFLKTLSPIERSLVAEAEFSRETLSATVRRLLLEAELTPQELAEGIGLTWTKLCRVLDGHEPASIDMLEAIAGGLGSAPEFFVEYRVKLISEWLREHPKEVDALFAELNWEPTLAEYVAWKVRPLPHPAQAGSRELLESLLKIVETDPGMRGDTVTGGTKTAKLETGAVVKVPLFVNQGESIRVDTRSGQYIARVK